MAEGELGNLLQKLKDVLALLDGAELHPAAAHVAQAIYLIDALPENERV